MTEHQFICSNSFAHINILVLFYNHKDQINPRRQCTSMSSVLYCLLIYLKTQETFSIVSCALHHYHNHIRHTYICTLHDKVTMYCPWFNRLLRLLHIISEVNYSDYILISKIEDTRPGLEIIKWYSKFTQICLNTFNIFKVCEACLYFFTFSFISFSQ